MSSITVWFIRCAMIYFLLAILLGIMMTVTGPMHPWMPIHTHFNLLGWMSMMIFGVGYHILPRFSGKPLWSDRLATAQLWIANIGLIGMAFGWIIRSSETGSSAFLTLFAVVEAVSIVFFVLNMLLTIKAAPAPAKPASAK